MNTTPAPAHSASPRLPRRQAPPTAGDEPARTAPFSRDAFSPRNDRLPLGRQLALTAAAAVAAGAMSTARRSA